MIRLNDGLRKIEIITAAQEEHAHVAVVDEAIELNELFETAIDMSSIKEDESIIIEKHVQSLPLLIIKRFRILLALKQLLNNAANSFTHK